MRLLVIGALAEHRLLIRKHAEIEWPDAVIIEHRLGKDPDLEPQFAAVGFDAVICVGAHPSSRIAQPASWWSGTAITPVPSRFS